MGVRAISNFHLGPRMLGSKTPIQYRIWGGTCEVRNSLSTGNRASPPGLSRACAVRAHSFTGDSAIAIMAAIIARCHRIG